MEGCSILKYDISTLVNDNWVVVHDLFEPGVVQRLEVHLVYLHDYFQGDEMNDAVFNCMLVRKTVNVEDLCVNSEKELDQAQAERDLATVFNELLGLVVGVLHDIHTFLDFWAEKKVEGHSARYFDVENPLVSIIGHFVIAFFILNQSHGHAKEHQELCTRDNDGVLEVQTLL